jgi:hypothetical protein
LVELRLENTKRASLEPPNPGFLLLLTPLLRKPTSSGYGASGFQFLRVVPTLWRLFVSLKRGSGTKFACERASATCSKPGVMSDDRRNEALHTRRVRVIRKEGLRYENMICMVPMGDRARCSRESGASWTSQHERRSARQDTPVARMPHRTLRCSDCTAVRMQDAAAVERGSCPS